MTFCPFCWKQSRICPSPGSLSGKWLDKGSIPASNTIVQSGVCYYFDPSDSFSICIPSGGVAHTGYSSVTGCSDPACSPATPCSSCSPGATPRKVRIDLSGLTLCSGVCYNSGAGAFVQYSGTLGHYDLPQTASPCVYSGTTTDITVSIWVGVACTGAPTATYNNMVLTWTAGGATPNIQWTGLATIFATVGATTHQIAHNGSSPNLTDCVTATTATNSAATSCQYAQATVNSGTIGITPIP